MSTPEQERKAQENYGRTRLNNDQKAGGGFKPRQRDDRKQRVSQSKPLQPRIPGHETLLYKAYSEKLPLEILEDREDEPYQATIIGYDAYTLLLKKADDPKGITVVFKHAISRFKVLPAKENIAE